MVIGQSVGLTEAALLHDTFKLMYEPIVFVQLASIFDAVIFLDHLDVVEDLFTEAIGKLILHFL